MKKASELNRRYWDALVPVHAASRFYDVDGFRAGASSLHSIETEAVGNVAGKSMLHLQCHFGLDTLSWARLGADVVGVDFSAASVAQGRKLAEEAGLASRATFVQHDVLDLRSVLDREFDIVFNPEPLQLEPQPDYADTDHTTLAAEAWIWSLSDVFGALEKAGLVVYEFKEYPRTVYKQFPQMRETSDGYWELPAEELDLPLLFSLKARRAGGTEQRL